MGYNNGKILNIMAASSLKIAARIELGVKIQAQGSHKMLFIENASKPQHNIKKMYNYLVDNQIRLLKPQTGKKKLTFKDKIICV